MKKRENFHSLCYIPKDSKDGKSLEYTGWPHVGMFQDSYLINNQQNYAHQYDLWEHSLQTVVGLPKSIENDMVYLAALVHDIGKPDCQSYDERAGVSVGVN